MRGYGVILGLVVLLSACSSDEEAAGVTCTAIGIDSGVSVTVTADAAPIRGLRLTICSAEDGVERPVRLTEGTSAGEESCTGDGPDDSCGVALTPDGAQHGFVSMPLTEGPVELAAASGRAGRSTPLGDVTLDAVATYPNGPDCGPGGTQAHATIGAGGLTP